MAFIDEVQTRSGRFAKRIEHLLTEEASKAALVLPFIQMLGYEIFDPTEVVPEFIADVGDKKGEKVDYALVMDGKPIILIEAKKYGSNLDKAEISQLFRYFHSTAARFGILTDGIVYRFFSDLDQPNVMDTMPFFEFNMLDFTDGQVEQLKRFTKTAFDLANIVDAARELKYVKEIKRVLAEELREPSADFVSLISKRIFDKLPTPSVRKKLMMPLVKQAFTQFINDRINVRFKSALEQGDEQVAAVQKEEATPTPIEKQPLSLPMDIYIKANWRDLDARGRLEEDGAVVVLAGSHVSRDVTADYPATQSRLRETMVNDGRLMDSSLGGDRPVYILTAEQRFDSPTAAAVFVLGYKLNGRWYWKDSEGQRLTHLMG